MTRFRRISLRPRNHFSKCTYCNFNKYINPASPPNERMLTAMKRELAFYMRHPKFRLQARKLHSIYFGGGTPTLAPVKCNDIFIFEGSMTLC